MAGKAPRLCRGLRFVWVFEVSGERASGLCQAIAKRAIKCPSAMAGGQPPTDVPLAPALFLVEDLDKCSPNDIGWPFIAIHRPFARAPYAIERSNLEAEIVAIGRKMLRHRCVCLSPVLAGFPPRGAGKAPRLLPGLGG